jgi:MFS family permease
VSTAAPAGGNRAGATAAAERRGIAVAGAAMAASNVAGLGLLALVPSLKGELALSTTAIGLIASTLFCAAALTTFAGGALTDRIGAVPTIIVAQAAAVCGVVVAAVAGGAVAFYAGVALIGVCYGILNPATNVLASAGIERGRRGLAMSIKQTGATVGGAAGALLLPLVAAAAGWRVAMLVPLVPCGLVAAWALRTPVTDPLEGGVRPGAGPGAGPAVGRGLAAYGFAMAGVQIAIFAYLTVYLVDVKGLSPALAGLGAALALAAGTVGRLLWGVVSDRLGERRAVPLAVASAGAGAALVALIAAPPWALWPVLAVIGFCAAGWNGVYHAMVADGAAPDRAGRASAIALFFVYAGSIALPPGLGLLAGGGSSWSATWLATAAVAVMAGCGLAAGRGIARPAPSAGFR